MSAVRTEGKLSKRRKMIVLMRLPNEGFEMTEFLEMLTYIK